MVDTEWSAMTSAQGIAKLNQTAPKLAEKLVAILEKQVDTESTILVKRAESEALMLDEERRIQDARTTVELRRVTQELDFAAAREQITLDRQKKLLDHKMGMEMRRFYLDVSALTLAFATVGASTPIAFNLSNSDSPGQALSLMTGAVGVAGALVTSAWRSGRLRPGSHGADAKEANESPP